MKKTILTIVATFLVTSLGWCLYQGMLAPKLTNDEYSKLESAYRPVYEQVKDEDFSTAKLNGDTITFYDKDRNVIKETELEDKFTAKLLYIEKRESDIVFWHSGFDDYDGILFTNDEWNSSSWNGIMRAGKLRGNAYLVYTYQ